MLSPSFGGPERSHSAASSTEEQISFTVRPMPRGASLEGAFRVHLATKHLEILGIKPGEICVLRTAEGNIGMGIAWRSTEAISKANTYPVKVTDIFRDAFNFKLGAQITIAQYHNAIPRASRVIVTDVSDHQEDIDQSKDDNCWKMKITGTLHQAHLIANNIAFEATSRYGMTKRFLVESVIAKGYINKGLYHIDDDTELILQDESAEVPAGLKSIAFDINANGIGGLDSQIARLNKQFAFLVGPTRGRKIRLIARRNAGFLLSGPSGVGKTMLLNRIAEGHWRRVHRINSRTLNSTASKNANTIAAVVTEALAYQPSLIIIDDIHRIAGASQHAGVDDNVAYALAEELQRLQNNKVVIIAAAPSPDSVNPILRGHDCLQREIEIPVPDKAARIAILENIHGTEGHGDEISEIILGHIGARTHGYTGRDLYALYSNAQERAWDRYVDNEGAPGTLNGNDSHKTPISTFDNVGTLTTTEAPHVEVTAADFESALGDVPPTVMKEIIFEKPNVKWTEIGGSQEIERLLREATRWPLEMERFMQRFGMSPEKGILLYGPPGCSKTLTAKAIAASSGLNFLPVRGAELTSMYVGESERAIREVFRKARAARPSIVFFDEIDSIASKRDAAGNSGLNTLTTLLNEMDGIDSQKGVLVLAATNRPHMLDPALLRPGRFDTKIYIGPPNEQARKEIFAIQLNRIPGGLDIDIDVLATRTDGFSGAEIVQICQEAKKEALRRFEPIWHSDRASQPGPLLEADIESALAKAVKRITPSTIQSFEDWVRGLE